MPNRAPKLCAHGGCGVVVASGYCTQHKKNHGWHANEQSKGNRHQRGYGTAWERLRLRILKRDHYQCQMCFNQWGRYTSASHVDHIKPKAGGGTDDATNLQSLCASCHRHKTAYESRG